jgi:hypothetical protein
MLLKANYSGFLSANKLFHICTVVNRLAKNNAMRASFIEAGYDEGRGQYSIFDNSLGNIYEHRRG